mgnify:CR=1 FL=1
MKTLQTFLRKSKAIVLFGVVILVSTFLLSAKAAQTSLGDPRLIVDHDECNGCGLCEAIAPNCFIVIDGKAEVIVGWGQYPEQYLLAIEDCPMAAISLENY